MSPNSNFPGPLRRRLPLIQEGMVPCTSVEIGSGVSSTERTRGAIVSSPFSAVVMHSLALPLSTGLVSSVGNTDIYRIIPKSDIREMAIFADVAFNSSVYCWSFFGC